MYSDSSKNYKFKSKMRITWRRMEHILYIVQAAFELQGEKKQSIGENAYRFWKSCRYILAPIFKFFERHELKNWD